MEETMAYKVLYRKYRPQDFNDLYGQDNIKTLLKESIKQQKLAHAYLFSGPNFFLENLEKRTRWSKCFLLAACFYSRKGHENPFTGEK